VGGEALAGLDKSADPAGLPFAAERQVSQARHTVSTSGAGWANTLIWRPLAASGPVRQAVSKL
jgi:hypothetical protein